MIGAVIFDMGNVLIDWDPHEAYRPHLPDAGGRVAFLGRYFRLMYDAVHDDPSADRRMSCAPEGGVSPIPSSDRGV